MGKVQRGEDRRWAEGAGSRTKAGRRRSGKKEGEGEKGKPGREKHKS